MFSYVVCAEMSSRVVFKLCPTIRGFLLENSDCQWIRFVKDKKMWIRALLSGCIGAWWNTFTTRYSLFLESNLVVVLTVCPNLRHAGLFNRSVYYRWKTQQQQKHKNTVKLQKCFVYVLSLIWNVPLIPE